MAEQSRELDGLKVKIDVDVSGALTGLKAVERQAKKATQALKEVESHAPYISLSAFSTKALSDELAKREGVTEHILPHPGSHARLNVATVDGGYPVFIEGPATILVNID